MLGQKEAIKPLAAIYARHAAGRCIHLADCCGVWLSNADICQD